MDADPANEPADEPFVAEVALADCWRCGKGIEKSLPRCPFCAAVPTWASSTSPQTATGSNSDSDSDNNSGPLFRLLAACGIFLAISAAVGIASQLAISAETPPPALAQQLLNWTVAAEVIDTLLVLAALAWISLKRDWQVPSAQRRLATWVLAVPALAGILALNFGYHWWLREVVGVPFVDSMESLVMQESGFTPLLFVIICVQPAVIEELFFRYLTLDVLRGTMGMHGAVLFSAVIFGLAHIGAPLSMPVLILLGVMLGYARVASGGIALPMLLHFAHNGAVLLMEYVDCVENV